MAITNAEQSVGETKVLRVQDLRTAPALNTTGEVDSDQTPAVRATVDADGQIGMELVNYDDILGTVPAAATAAGYSLRVFNVGFRRYQMVFTLSDATVTTVDGDTSGAGGGVKIFDFVQGAIRPAGGWGSITTIAATGGAGNNTVCDFGVGSVIADDSQQTLTSTKQDLLNEGGITLASGVFNAALGTGTGAPWGAVDSATIIDGTTTAVDAYFNVACGAPQHGASDGEFTINGVLSFIVELTPDY